MAEIFGQEGTVFLCYSTSSTTLRSVQQRGVNLFRPVHIKTLTSQHRRALLTARKLLQEKAVAIENDIRGLLRNFGLKGRKRIPYWVFNEIRCA
jgi:transposase